MSILGTATSALLTFQQALKTTSNNIANSATEGYTRQVAELATRGSEGTGRTAVGQGVYTTSVKRIQSEIVNGQLRASLSDFSYDEGQSVYARQLDSLLSNDTTGLEVPLQEFFAALQDVSTDPSSLTGRTVFLGEAETMAGQFNALSTQVDELNTAINDQLEISVNELNDLTTRIAELNGQIINYGSGGAPANLLDMRDLLLNRLSEKVDVSTNLQDDGSMSVFIGNGQTLVIGTTATELTTGNLSGDADSVEIGVVSPYSATPADITRFITGGELGGLLELREEVIEPTKNELGRLAITLGSTFNAQNALGLDLDGQLGSAIFSVPDPAVTADTANTATGTLTVTVADATALTTRDYRLSYDGTNYALEIDPDKTSVTLTPDPSTAGVYLADGLSIDTTALASPPATAPAAGDNWLIEPTRDAAAGISVVMTDPRGIAAAAAVYAEPNDLNTGGVEILDARAVDGTDVNLLTPVAVVYDGTNYMVHLDNPPPPPPPPAPTTATATTNADGTVTVAANGWELTLSGTPATNDEFLVAPTTDLTGDNTNLLLMADLQSAELVGGSESFQGNYATLVGDVATETNRILASLDATTTILESAQAAREEISGVNLDEEAADLVRYQQAYEAAAQVIAVSNTLFDTLIEVVR